MNNRDINAAIAALNEAVFYLEEEYEMNAAIINN